MESVMFLFVGVFLISQVAAQTSNDGRVIKCVWTEWMSRDEPGGSGDWEYPLNRLLEFGGCLNPEAMEVRRVSDHIPAGETGQVFKHYSAAKGFVCENNMQGPVVISPRWDSTSAEVCDDYEIRQCCPPKDCTWSGWLNRDNPGGSGDWETLESLHEEGLPGACLNAQDLRARRVSDRTLAPEITTAKFRYFDLDRGFACINDEQGKDWDGCSDYEVKLCCPNNGSGNKTGPEDDGLSLIIPKH